MDNQPQVIQEDHLENTGQCGPGVEGKEVVELRGRVSSGVLASRGTSKNRQRKREVEEVDKGKVAPGVTVGSLRRFRAAMIGPTQGLPRTPAAASAAPKGEPENPERTVLEMFAFVCKCEVVAIRGYRTRSLLALHHTVHSGCPSLCCAHECMRYVVGSVCLSSPYQSFLVFSFCCSCLSCVVFREKLNASKRFEHYNYWTKPLHEIFVE